MDVTRLLNLTGTVVTVTEGEPDVYGDATEETTEREVRYWTTSRAAVEASSERLGSAGNWQDAERILYLPPDDPLTGRDRFRDRDGVLWEVTGPPDNHVHPRTQRSVYVSAGLRRVS